MTQGANSKTFAEQLADVSTQFEAQSEPIAGFEPAQEASGKPSNVLGQFDDGSGRSWGFFDETWQWHSVEGGEAEAREALKAYAAAL